MRREHVRDLLRQVADGSLDADHALDALAFEPSESLGFATIDHHRALRQGYPEVIYGAGKTPEQVREIAVRIALGARPGRVIAMVLRETAGLVGAGLALGGALAYAGSRLIDSQLFGVAAHDPLTLGLATGLMLLVALCAAYLPARRASRLDPMAALRQE
jgi:hypothetical protein